MRRCSAVSPSSSSARPARVCGVNIEGLRRKNFSREAIAAIKAEHKTLFHSSLNVSQALARLKGEGRPSEHVAALIAFIEDSSRGIAR